MKIALIGKGKMGKATLEIAQERGHEIVEVPAADVAIDFSVGEAVKKTALSIQIPWVLGTTGWDKKEILSIVEERGVPLLYAPNFSIGMALFRKLAKEAHVLFQGFEMEGEEVHHTEKRDIPSGTALRLMEDIDGLSFVSLREGKEVGTHTIRFKAPEEEVEISHRALDRKVFARGAVRAAEWLIGRKGIYTFEHCIEEIVECSLAASQQP